MATARNIYPDAVAANNPVTITYANGQLTVSNLAVMMNSTDTITFSNSPNSDSQIQIVFAPNPPGVPNPPGPAMFTSPVVLNPGDTTGPLTPQVPPANPNGSVNYTIWASGVDVGDNYAVQVGNGPLYVTAKGATTSVTFTPVNTRVPDGGTIEFYSTDAATHGISWKNNNNPFTSPSPLTDSYAWSDRRTQSYTDTGGDNEYPYSPGPGIRQGGGGGTVKIGQTP